MMEISQEIERKERKRKERKMKIHFRFVVSIILNNSLSSKKA